MSLRHPPRWKVTLVTTNHRYAMGHPTLERAQAHVVRRRGLRDVDGHELVGGWIEDPEGEVVEQFGDPTFAAVPHFRIFTSSKNKGQRESCSYCREWLKGGATYYLAPIGMACPACAEVNGLTSLDHPLNERWRSTWESKTRR